MGTILGTVKITIAFRLSTEKVVLCVWCVQLRCICLEDMDSEERRYSLHQNKKKIQIQFLN